MDLSSASFNFEYDGEDFTIPINNYKLRGCQWKPENSSIKFGIIYVHDIAMFSTINHDVINIFIDRGGSIVCCDHIGHGRSPGSRVSCTIDEIVNETKDVIIKTCELLPNLPIFLWGTGVGGLAIIQLVFDHLQFVAQYLNGIILESPFISQGPGKLSLFSSFFLSLAAKYFPNYLFSQEPVLESFSPSVSKEFSEKCISSPLYMPFITPRALSSILSSMTEIRMKYMEWPKNLPLLFLQGKDDKIVNVEESYSWVKDLIDSTSNKDIQIKLYDTDTSLLLKTEKRPEVLEDMICFINHYSQN